MPESEIGVAIRIQQAQPGKVTLRSELLRRGREKEQAGDFRGECLDQRVGGAGGFGAPFQMMGFIDDEQIPACIERLFGTRF